MPQPNHAAAQMFEPIKLRIPSAIHPVFDSSLREPRFLTPALR